MSNRVLQPFGGLVLTQLRVFADARGEFFELFRASANEVAGFVQDNVSVSKRGVLRGLHYQEPFAQGKLVVVLAGEIYDVAVDIRSDSPTFRQWFGATLSEQNRQQLYVPPGFAHGFAVLSESATVLYKCTEYYRPECEGILRWNDPELGIDWPVAEPLLSAKDAQAPLLRDVTRATLPRSATIAGTV